MKIYILYDNPYEEGDNVYGAFSTEEKANIAYEIFSPVSNHQLYIREIELDELEQYYERVKSGKRLYFGTLPKTTYLLNDGLVNKWNLSPCGLDSFFEKDAHKNTLCEFGGYFSATVVASSPEDAEKITNELIEKIKYQPKDEKWGWRYIEDEN